jgi:hypothetical protein
MDKLYEFMVHHHILIETFSKGVKVEVLHPYKAINLVVYPLQTHLSKVNY